MVHLVKILTRRCSRCPRAAEVELADNSWTWLYCGRCAVMVQSSSRAKPYAMPACSFFDGNRTPQAQMVIDRANRPRYRVRAFTA